MIFFHVVKKQWNEGPGELIGFLELQLIPCSLVSLNTGIQFRKQLNSQIEPHKTQTKK